MSSVKATLVSRTPSRVHPRSRARSCFLTAVSALIVARDESLIGSLAVCRIKHLEVENASLHEKAMDVQRELQRQRAINEQLLMRVAGTALPSGMPQAMPMAH